MNLRLPLFSTFLVGIPGILTFGCGTEPGSEGDGSAHSRPLTDIPRVPGFSQEAFEVAPPDNPLTEGAAQLGKRLFFERRLSRDGTVSCGSCHDQAHAFADPRVVSLGVDGRAGKRNAPHLTNLAWVRTGLFWDGRVTTLEEQALEPIPNPDEMDLPLTEAVVRLEVEPDYVAAFEEVFAEPPSAELLAKALASFVRTLVSANSPYDRYLAGDEAALSDAAQRGLGLFSGPAGCFHCHSDQTLTNDGFFNNGTYVDGHDIGRKAITGRTSDLGKFRVPNLRNVAVTAPYMHDGSMTTLEDVIDHYDAGGLGDPSTDPQIEELFLDKGEKADLLAFLESLTDEGFLSDARFRAD